MSESNIYQCWTKSFFPKLTVRLIFPCMLIKSTLAVQDCHCNFCGTGIFKVIAFTHYTVQTNWCQMKLLSWLCKDLDLPQSGFEQSTLQIRGVYTTLKYCKIRAVRKNVQSRIYFIFKWQYMFISGQCVWLWFYETYWFRCQCQNYRLII